ncbi:MAG: hypothetical protein NXH75_10210 [Halobacteriovoraceae bacterium]|nr:hypothetical protein [Halobacteriovoraceae bacterium]
MSVNFKHPTSGLIKECPEGFSWTTFFFNGWVPLFRGMWTAFAITLFSGGLAGLYYMFTINKIYATDLMEKGYSPASDLDVDKLSRMGISISRLESKSENKEPAKQIEEEQVAS